MEKFKRFLAAVGSIFVVVVGCYLFAAGFNELLSTNFLVNMFGAACLLVGGYNFFAGMRLLVGVLSNKKLTLTFFVVDDAYDEKEDTDNEH